LCRVKTRNVQSLDWIWDTCMLLYIVNNYILILGYFIHLYLLESIYKSKTLTPKKLDVQILNNEWTYTCTKSLFFIHLNICKFLPLPKMYDPFLTPTWIAHTIPMLPNHYLQAIKIWTPYQSVVAGNYWYLWQLFWHFVNILFNNLFGIIHFWHFFNSKKGK